MAEMKWLMPWLKYPYYKGKCKKHDKQYRIAYCTLCMEPPLCNICWSEKKNQHCGHPSLKVCIASWRAAININEISKFLDISGIQQNVINSGLVVHLNKKEVNAINLTQNHKKPQCKVCKANLCDPAYDFCSIACKITNVAVEEKITTKEKVVEEENNHARKRRRKGIPCRSPLF